MCSGTSLHTPSQYEYEYEYEYVYAVCAQGVPEEQVGAASAGQLLGARGARLVGARHAHARRALVGAGAPAARLARGRIPIA